jgi:hypothetical protein
MGAFLAFDKMITPTFIKIVYWVGIAGIILSGIIGAISAAAVQSGLAAFGSFIVVILVAIAGLFVWRMYCELIILWFKIHEELVGIRHNTAK